MQSVNELLLFCHCHFLSLYVYCLLCLTGQFILSTATMGCCTSSYAVAMLHTREFIWDCSINFLFVGISFHPEFVTSTLPSCSACDVVVGSKSSKIGGTVLG